MNPVAEGLRYAHELMSGAEKCEGNTTCTFSGYAYGGAVDAQNIVENLSNEEYVGRVKYLFEEFETPVSNISEMCLNGALFHAAEGDIGLYTAMQEVLADSLHDRHRSGTRVGSAVGTIFVANDDYLHSRQDCLEELLYAVKLAEERGL